MHTQRTIMLIVLAVFLAGVAAVVGVIWWLGLGLGAIVIVVAAVVLAVVYLRVIRPWYLRWGTTDDEVAMAMPGDELIPDTDPATRAIGIAAQPEDVWPWLVQLGFGKAGWYSYDWIDNDGHPSADEVIPEYQTLSVGDQILMMPEMGFTVTSVDPDRSIVSMLDDGSTSWCLGLYPQDGDVTRLVSRWRPKLGKTNPAAAFFAAIAGPGSFIMEQKMLRGIRDRAERTAERRRNGSGEAG
jgi:hypothetical protein